VPAAKRIAECVDVSQGTLLDSLTGVRPSSAAATNDNGSGVGLANPSTKGKDHLAAPEDGRTPEAVGGHSVVAALGCALSREIAENGFAIVRNVLPPSRRQALIDALGPVAGAGRRGLLGVPMVARLANSRRILGLVRPHVPGEPRAVRAIYFDKTPDKNWLVSWHQDLTVAIASRVDVPGFGLWSIKDGVVHVQPPVEVLERMLTARVHLDACDESNGALRVLPGSHRLGRLASAQIAKLNPGVGNVLCRVAAGDALLMRPLLLHASGRSVTPSHRRILHLEYAGEPLPGGLEWHEVKMGFNGSL
jgi:hypothetical protein